ncbi:MAG: hypothetical protein QE271_01470 [Bacteriovoracaceae bacterium]|nr:hypothetical protein [Bacteriovoracaceae bacterium]
MKIFLSLLLQCLLAFSTFAEKKPIRPWETTQMKSMGGAGLGNLTMINGLYNNPAMLSFFTNSLAYLQINSSKLENATTTTRNSLYGNDTPPKGFTVGITDSSNENKGGVTYQDYKESGIDRKRYGFSMSSLINRDMSIGAQYNYTTDKFKDNSTAPAIDDKFHQGNFSFTYLVSPKLNLSLLWFDPFKSAGYESKSMIASQVTIVEKVLLFVDFGMDITSSLEETYILNWATEINFFRGFYFRYGRFLDRIINQQGYGTGLGYNGERFSLEFAIKNSERKTDQGLFLLEGEKLKETSFSLTYLF